MVRCARKRVVVPYAAALSLILIEAGCESIAGLGSLTDARPAAGAAGSSGSTWLGDGGAPIDVLGDGGARDRALGDGGATLGGDATMAPNSFYPCVLDDATLDDCDLE